MEKQIGKFTKKNAKFLINWKKFQLKMNSFSMIFKAGPNRLHNKRKDRKVQMDG